MAALKPTPYTHPCPIPCPTPRMFKGKLFMKVIGLTKTGISVRKEERRLPIHGVLLFFPRRSSSLRRHYLLIFDPDVIFYLIRRQRSRQDGAGKICLNNYMGSGDEDLGSVLYSIYVYIDSASLPFMIRCMITSGNGDDTC